MEDQDKSWYVLHTKSRFEKKLAEILSNAGYRTYCPLKKINKQWSDRTKVVEEPLFKCYLFIQIERQRRDEVFDFPGVIRYVFLEGRPAEVRQKEISVIQKWLGEYKHKDIDISDILPGSFVRITSGQFSGEEGVLVDRTNNRAIIQLKEIGIQLSLSISNNDLMSI